MIVLEDTSEPFSTGDGAVTVGLVAAYLDQLVFETLVIALKVVMVCVIFHGFTEVALAERHDPGQTL